MVDVLNKLLFIYFTRDVLYLTFPFKLKRRKLVKM